LRGEEVYIALQKQLRKHCIRVRNLLLTVEDADAAAAKTSNVYMARYEQHMHVADLMKNVLRFLERHCIIREPDEHRYTLNGHEVYTIKDLHKEVWKEEILKLDDNASDLAGEGMG